MTDATAANLLAPDHTETGAADVPLDARTRTKRRRAVIAFVAVLAVVGGYLGLQQWIGNFHTVIAGELYRSAQLDAGDLAQHQKDYGIRTIINLRGPSDAAWYKDEVAESEALGIRHIDFKLSAGRELTDAQVDQLVALMETAEKPLLLHCRGGSDRSGIASAIYLAAIAKADEAAAERQLSIYYGHFPIPFFPAWAMDQTFERLETRFGYPGS
ncbi:MAG TPA: tyrosine-protein phosphatase [Xanthobacteraceae bacterium]|nr:tyrosine-protein phosphatase [Xanthobacteraceae bacterium]